MHPSAIFPQKTINTDYRNNEIYSIFNQSPSAYSTSSCSSSSTSSSSSPSTDHKLKRKKSVNRPLFSSPRLSTSPPANRRTSQISNQHCDTIRETEEEEEEEDMNKLKGDKVSNGKRNYLKSEINDIDDDSFQYSSESGISSEVEPLKFVSSQSHLKLTNASKNHSTSRLRKELQNKRRMFYSHGNNDEYDEEKPSWSNEKKVDDNSKCNCCPYGFHIETNFSFELPESDDNIFQQSQHSSHIRRRSNLPIISPPTLPATPPPPLIPLFYTSMRNADTINNEADKSDIFRQIETEITNNENNILNSTNSKSKHSPSSHLRRELHEGETIEELMVIKQIPKIEQGKEEDYYRMKEEQLISNIDPNTIMNSIEVCQFPLKNEDLLLQTISNDIYEEKTQLDNNHVFSRHSRNGSSIGASTAGDENAFSLTSTLNRNSSQINSPISKKINKSSHQISGKHLIPLSLVTSSSSSNIEKSSNKLLNGTNKKNKRKFLMKKNQQCHEKKLYEDNYDDNNDDVDDDDLFRNINGTKKSNDNSTIDDDTNKKDDSSHSNEKRLKTKKFENINNSISSDVIKTRYIPYEISPKIQSSSSVSSPSFAIPISSSLSSSSSSSLLLKRSEIFEENDKQKRNISVIDNLNECVNEVARLNNNDKELISNSPLITRRYRKDQVSDEIKDKRNDEEGKLNNLNNQKDKEATQNEENPVKDVSTTSSDETTTSVELRQIMTERNDLSSHRYLSLQRHSTHTKDYCSNQSLNNPKRRAETPSFLRYLHEIPMRPNNNSDEFNSLENHSNNFFRLIDQTNRQDINNQNKSNYYVSPPYHTY
ncbi:hypothetical protein SNEBB_008714 [Seison nebaliae]|nr:hypothetical protein SNEBB_008714 [Seison nebaliae]